MRSYFNFLKKNKAYTIIDVAGLAISIMFIVLIGGYTWQETHIDSEQTKKDRLYFLSVDMDGQKVSGSHWRMLRKLMDRFPEIETGTGIVGSHRLLVTMDGENITSDVLFVDSTFFEIFDFDLIRGDRKKVLSSPNSIVVTEEYARKIWNDEDPMGKTIIYNTNDDPLIVTGIMAPMENTSISSPDFESKTNRIDALIPMEMVKYYNSSLYDEGMSNGLGIELLLLEKEGTDLKGVEAKIHDYAKEFFWLLNLPENDVKMELLPFKEHYFSNYTSPSGAFNRGNFKMVKILFTTGLVILLFALMNYINLTVALSGHRAKEMATRRLLGDTRTGIILKLIGESTLLCSLSALIGLVLAWLALPVAEQLLETSISMRNFVTPVTVSIFVGIILIMGTLAGLTPAVLISSSKPIDVVRGTFRRQTKMIFSKVFIVIQNVITIVMIASALTMYLQIRHMINAPLGYETENIMYIPNGGTIENARLFKQRIEQLPGVEMVSATQGHPLTGGNNNTLVYEGRTISFQTFTADENFMKILGLTLTRDNKTADSDKYYLNRQALDELGLPENAQSYPYYDRMCPVSGIVKDFNINTIIDVQHPIRIVITNSTEMYPWGFLVKVNGDHEKILNSVNEIYKDIFQWENSDLRPFLTQQIEDRFSSQKNIMKIVAIFAAIAIIISMLGLMAMSTYFVQMRSKEIAIKKVLGCDSGVILRRLVLSFLSYVVIAFFVAIPIIYWFMNDWLSEFSYRISLYWWIYAAAGLTCIVVSLLSVYIQSYNAANGNPVKALYQN